MKTLKAFVIALSFLHIVEANKIFYVISVKCPLDYADSVAHYSCSLSRPRQEIALLNLSLRLNKVAYNVTSHHKITVKRNYHLTETFLEFDMDLCQSESSDSENTVAKVIAAKVNQDILLPLDCPLKEGFSYKAIKYPFNAGILPENLPSVAWNILTDYYINGKRAFTFNMHGRIEDIKNLGMHTLNQLDYY